MTSPEGKIANSQFNDASLGLRGGLKHGDDRELLFAYNHFQGWDVGLPGGSAFPATATVKYLGFTRNQLSGEYIFSDLTDVVKSVSVKAYTQNISREVENIVNPKLAIFPGSMNITSGLKAVSELYFNDYNTMTVGAETWFRDQKTTRYRIAVPGDTIITGEQPTPNATMLDAGIFARYTRVIDPKYWTLNAGVRADYIRTSNEASLKEVFKYKYENGERTRLLHDSTVLFSDRKKNQLAYAAHVDLTYTPAKAHKLILSIANAYRVASLEERFKYIDQAGTLRVGNPSLKPEMGLFSNFSYGFTSSRFVLKTDIFANYMFDLITEKLGTYTYVNGPTVAAWVNSNVDRALYLGAELEMKWLITDDLSFQTHVSYVNTTDLQTKEQLPLTPPLHGVIDVHYHVHNLFGLALSVDWEYESEDEHEDETLVDAHRHAIFSLSLESEPYKIKGIGLQLYAGVNNIFNTAYQEHLSTLRGINRLEPGRNIYLRTKISW
jgi:outer membrane receptor protein involved in Fe transport